MKVQSKLGAVLIIALAVGLAGIVGVFVIGGGGGGDGETPETNTPETNTPISNDPGGEVEPDSVEATVWLYNATGRTVDSGTLTLYDESGAEVESHDLSDGEPRITFTDLNANDTYTLEATELQDQRWPSQTRTVQPGEADEVDIVTGYEFQGADSWYYEAGVWRNASWEGQPTTLYNVVNGTHNNGNEIKTSIASRSLDEDPRELNYDPHENLYLDGEVYYDNTQSGDDWEVKDDPIWEPPVNQPSRAVDNLSEYMDDRTYNRTVTVESGALTVDHPYNSPFEDPFNETVRGEGETIDVYDLNLSPRQTATVYIHRETGYLIKFESDILRQLGEAEPAEITYIFFNHNDVEGLPLEEFGFEE